MTAVMSCPVGLLFALSLLHIAATLRLADQQEGASQTQAQQGRRLRAKYTIKQPSLDKIIKVTADAAVKQLHMVLHNLPPVAAGYGIEVDTVDAGMWAAKAGIKPGSEILTINGLVAKTMPMKEFIGLLKKRPVSLTVGPKKQAPAVGLAVAAQAPAAAAAAAAALPPAVPASTVVPAVPAVPAAAAPAVAEKKEVVPTPKPVSFDPKASAKSAFEAAVAAGKAAGAEAGSAAAGQLVKDLKKALGIKEKKLKEEIKADFSHTFAAPTTTVAAPGAPGAPAPAPAAPWEAIIPGPPPSYTAEAANPRNPNSGPPEPVPPSPLDALKAAMAIRASINATDGPLLSNDVIERVAQVARERLGEFMPGPPSSPSAAPCSGISPAPAPFPMSGEIVEKVEVKMTVKNMSFTALTASPGMRAEFEQTVKASMAEAAGPGVRPADIEVHISAGSVVVDAKIAPPPGVKASDMDGNMKAGNNSLGTMLIARVKALPGIKSIALGDISATEVVIAVIQEVVPTTPTTTTTPPTRHLPKPPKCAAPPPEMSKGDVAMALAPFKPPGARGKAVKTKDGGSAWPLQDGGWAFQYPDMALRMQEDGSTRIVWSKPAYSVEYDESGISYHVGKNVVHRDTNGDLTYQQPTGTMHQEGSTLVYHWCNPNVIVYQTPAGFVYYDDMGMTYRSFGKDVTHYTWSGQVLYQGAGGVTEQGTDGTVTHWTDAGAVYRHKDGSVTYTPVGESTSSALSVSDLGPDPYPGAALTTDDVMQLSVPAAAPSPANPAAAAWEAITPQMAF